MHKIHYVPECFAETAMVKTLFDQLDYLDHEFGIENVSRVLKKEDFKDYLNIGFIDNDKRQPPYFDEFEVLDSRGTVILKKHKTKKDYLIIVSPTIERFLLSQLREIEKLPSDYGFPDEFKAFCKKMKKTNIQNNEEFKRMILELKKSNASGISFIIEKINQVKFS